MKLNANPSSAHDRQRAILWLLLPVCLLSLAGCDSNTQDRRIELPDSGPITTQNQPLGIPNVPISGNLTEAPAPPPITVTASGGFDTVPTGTDRSSKVHLLYVLLGAAKRGNAGQDDPNLLQVLTDVRQQAGEVQEDQYQQQILEILQLLQDAVEARKAETMLQKSGINPFSVPWGAGEKVLESRMKELYSASSTPNTLLLREREETLNFIRHYNMNHGRSPTTAKREAFARAEKAARQALKDFPSPDLGEVKGVKDASKDNPEPIE